MARRLLILILVSSTLVRIWGINFGLPFTFHFDEPITLYTAFYLAANNLRPDMFILPMLYPYFMMVILGIYFVLGLTFGLWNSPYRFFVAYVNDPTVFLLLGRIVTLLVGVASVFLTYWVGKRVFSERVGLVASFFLGFSFLHVQESHYINEDVMMGLFSLGSFYLNFRVATSGRLRYYALSGLIIGLAASLKYNFIVLLPAFLIALFYRNRKKILAAIFDKKPLLAAFVSLVTFFSLNPYVILEHEKAIPAIVFQASTTTTQWVDSGGLPVWLYYLTYHLRYGMSLPLLGASILGAFYLLVKREFKGLLLISAPFTFFALLAVFGGANFSRYAVMILPQLVIAAGVLITKLKSPRLIAFLSFLVVFPSFVRIIKFDYYLTAPDTRVLAKRWIEENIPGGTKIANEGAVRSYYRSIFGPSLTLDRESVEAHLKEVKGKGQPGYWLEALLKKEVGYDLLGTLNLDFELNPESLEYTRLTGVEKYVEQSFCYLISTSWAKGNRGTYEKTFKDSLERHYELIKEFSANPQLSEDPSWRVDFKALDEVYSFDPEALSGPNIKIYKARDKGC